MYKHILVPIAFDHAYDGFDPVEVAKRLAAPDAQITLIHVIEEIPSYALSYMPMDMMAETREAIRKELGARAASTPNCQAYVIDGHAGRSILDWAEEHGVDLIVMASHHPGLGDYLLGSTAARVVRHAQCAVHVMR
ncbi:universal stress protein [Marivivens aquimaris]|uniref:universal stress protein n=1 Tax=Marivivens aquimaris TaxID=2774876 RepID=UPI00187DFEB2|nr:universal stress protein [Marivivens aquimaris]